MVVCIFTRLHDCFYPMTSRSQYSQVCTSLLFLQPLLMDYSQYVPQDTAKLILLQGGNESFINRLNLIFDQVNTSSANDAWRLNYIQNYFDVTDEPSQQIPFMYHYVNRPGLSTQRSRMILAESYNTTVNGLPGNDDSGKSCKSFGGRRLIPAQVPWAATPYSISWACTRFPQHANFFSLHPISRRSRSITRFSIPRRRSLPIISGATLRMAWAELSLLRFVTQWRIF